MLIWQLILIQVVTFAGLIFVLRMLFYQQLNSAMKRLKALHEEEQIKEAQLREELERAKQERASEVEKGRLEAKTLIETARKEAESYRLKFEEQAKHQAENILNHGKEELDKLKGKLLSEIEDRALNLCIQMIKYAFTESGRVSLQHQLINELIQEITNIEKDKFTVKTNKVKVTSCFALSDKEKEDLRHMLCGKIGSDIILQEELSPELIAGLVIQIDVLVMDGSLLSKLKKIAPYLRGDVKAYS